MSNNTINIGSAQNTQIQQDVSNANQSLSVENFDADLKSFLDSFIPDISKIQDLQTAQLLKADAETISTQINSPAPKKGIMKECLLSIKNILEGATGSVLASYLPVITPLLLCL